jgi:hypothetical protein
LRISYFRQSSFISINQLRLSWDLIVSCPILTYGLEIVLPKGKNLDNINRQYKKWIKQIISLYINVADPAVFILAGTLPIEASKSLDFQ